MAAVKRLTPKPETLRALYLLSGNVCAFPDCPTVMVSRNGTMIGEVCHIEAAEEKGPRFNKDMNNEQRRSQSNLFLLCPTHHTAIDKNPGTHTAAKLKAMKKKHESSFSEIGETLQQRFEEQFSDHTDAIIAEYPTTFAALTASPYGTLTPKQIEKEARAFKTYIDNLRNMPNTERQFTLSVLRRAQKLGGRRDPVYVHADDLTSALRIGSTKLKRLAESLERHSIGDLREHHNNEWVVQIYDPGEYIGWAQLMAFADEKGIPLDKFVIDVQFHDLD
jgi:hypothetical protein